MKCFSVLLALVLLVTAPIFAKTVNIEYIFDSSGSMNEIMGNEMKIDIAKRTLTELIEKLPEDMRIAIMLREFEGMSYEDIAQTMSCPVGTVRSRIFRAREAIDTKLQPLLDKR